MKHIGFVIRDERKRIGMEQQELASELGISVFCLNRVEHGRRSFDDAWVAKLPPAMRKTIADEIAEGYMDRAERIRSTVMRRRSGQPG